MTFNSRELRTMEPARAEAVKKKIKKFPLYIILENVLDTYNIGGFFRLADAVAARKIYLCGETATPPDPKIRKAAVGTDKLVPWQYRASAAEAIAELKKRNKSLRVIAVEQTKRSRDYRDSAYHWPLVFVFGNETFGLSAETLAAVDDIIELPMFGANKSLNVMVAAGISLYWALNKIDDQRK